MPKITTSLSLPSLLNARLPRMPEPVGLSSSGVMGLTNKGWDAVRVSFWTKGYAVLDGVLNKEALEELRNSLLGTWTTMIVTPFNGELRCNSITYIWQARRDTLRLETLTRTQVRLLFNQRYLVGSPWS